MSMRIVNDVVSQWSCGRYFACLQGDEVLLKATTDEAAIKEAEELVKEVEAYEVYGDPNACLPMD